MLTRPRVRIVLRAPTTSTAAPAAGAAPRTWPRELPLLPRPPSQAPRRPPRPARSSAARRKAAAGGAAPAAGAAAADAGKEVGDGSAGVHKARVPTSGMRVLVLCGRWTVRPAAFRRGSRGACVYTSRRQTDVAFALVWGAHANVMVYASCIKSCSPCMAVKATPSCVCNAELPPLRAAPVFTTPAALRDGFIEACS
eukprot:365700-Chlamydomonas_euryale.AAC.8